MIAPGAAKEHFAILDMGEVMRAILAASWPWAWDVMLIVRR